MNRIKAPSPRAALITSVMGFMSVVVMAGSAVAVEPEATPAKESPVDGGLGGPKVAESKATTLVVRDLGGKVQRLEVPPAEAALKLLSLSDDQKAKIDTLLAERAAIMDSIVRDHLKEVVQLANLGQAARPGAEAGKGESDQVQAKAIRAEYRELLQGLMSAAEPLRKRGVLGQELQPILTVDQRALLRHMGEDYMQARIADEVEAAKAKGETLRPQQVMAAESLQFVVSEIKRAYERVVGQRNKDFEAFIAKLSLTPQQEGDVRKVVGDSFAASYGQQSPAERARVFGEVYRVLTPQQREIVVELIGGGKGASGDGTAKPIDPAVPNAPDAPK